MAAASTIIAGAGLAVAAGSAVSQADAQRKAAHAQQDAANAAAGGAGTVDINALDKQARDIAKQNAADSAALENQYNPGASQLRANSLAALNNNSTSVLPQSIIDQITGQAGAMPTGINYDSPLLRQAIAKASSDLSLGGAIPLDARNAAARSALAKSGLTSGGLGLGRDLVARDLGLTSLDLQQQRLNNASTLGNAEAALGQGNAALSLQAQLAGTNNLFNTANLLNSIGSGDFAQKLALAQFGQNIAQPASGLDPGSIANLAVGNSNATAAGQQQAAALQAAAANQKSAQAGQLIGTGLGIASKYFTPSTYTPTTTYAPAGTVGGATAAYSPYSSAGVLNGFGGYNY